MRFLGTESNKKKVTIAVHSDEIVPEMSNTCEELVTLTNEKARLIPGNLLRDLISIKSSSLCASYSLPFFLFLFVSSTIVNSVLSFRIDNIFMRFYVPIHFIGHNLLKIWSNFNNGTEIQSCISCMIKGLLFLVPFMNSIGLFLWIDRDLL